MIQELISRRVALKQSEAMEKQVGKVEQVEKQVLNKEQQLQEKKEQMRELYEAKLRFDHHNYRTSESANGP